MKARFAILSLVLLVGTGSSNVLTAQQATTSSSSVMASSNDVNPANRRESNSANRQMGFRVTDWKTIHAHDPQAAQADIDTLKKLGCEVVSNNHGDHIDFRYRCPEWKSIEVPTDMLLSQWSDWMTAKGMETVTIDPPATTNKPTVRYRLPTARTIHMHDPQQSTQIVSTMKMIGVSVSSNNHGNHIDATFQCPQWKSIEVSTEEQAHSWQDWLDEAGFETQHTH